MNKTFLFAKQTMGTQISCSIFLASYDYEKDIVITILKTFLCYRTIELFGVVNDGRLLASICTLNWVDKVSKCKFKFYPYKKSSHSFCDGLIISPFFETSYDLIDALSNKLCLIHLFAGDYLPTVSFFIVDPKPKYSNVQRKGGDDDVFE